MMEVYARLKNETPDSTLRRLMVVSDDIEVFSCYTLEDGKRGKKVPGETRIPAGRYKLMLRSWGGFHERYTKRFGKEHLMVEITGIPDFRDVLIHMGNTISDTRGCMLPGQTYWKDRRGNYTVGRSEAAYLKLHELIASELRSGKEVYLNVID